MISSDVTVTFRSVTGLFDLLQQQEGIKSVNVACFRSPFWTNLQASLKLSAQETDLLMLMEFVQLSRNRCRYDTLQTVATRWRQTPVSLSPDFGAGDAEALVWIFFIFP